ncbi:MAG: hypothetical protein HQK60_07045 [Deltaproteobacteria bacterium]|nr:hypothetical protein [Deltaproteobacteria bacterium]
MAIKTKIICVIVFASVILGDTGRWAFGCGPWPLATCFSYRLHPDEQLSKFAQGGLGIIKPTNDVSYLYAAYRYLNGSGFSSEEWQALETLWRSKSQDQPLGTFWDQEWLNARNQVPGLEPPPRIYIYRSEKKQDYYIDYVNCPPDAFKTAISSLNALIKKFGVAGKEVKDWVSAQDQVFANCQGGETIPGPMASAADAQQKADRTYQIAAANFYAGNLDTARQLFTEISKDSTSPWRELAPYLVARCLIRQATLIPEAGKFDAALMAQAETKLKEIAQDNSLSRIHPAAARMLQLINFRLHPAELAHEFTQALLSPDVSKKLPDNLGAYTWLLKHYPAAVQTDDLGDWIKTFQDPGEAALQHAMAIWEKKATTPWLLAGLSKIKPDHPKFSALYQAAEQVKPDSPAFLTCAFHLTRLLIASGKLDEARSKLDGLLAQPGLPVSVRNLLLSLRMPLSRNLDEFLKFAPRAPIGIYYDDGAAGLDCVPGSTEGMDVLKNKEFLFDDDASELIRNKFPLNLVLDAATNQSVPVNLRRNLAQAGWVKAVLLNDEPAGLAFAAALKDLVPELQDCLEAYFSAEDGQGKRFAAMLLMLKFPGMQPEIYSGVGRTTPLNEIDDLRDNWWQPWTQEATTTATGGAKPHPDFPAFFNPVDKFVATIQREQLLSLPAAANILCQEVIQWARLHPKDPRVPEALHLAVKSTRYSWGDEDTANFSKAAFQLLHQKYPKSDWAKQTKYWFGK